MLRNQHAETTWTRVYTFGWGMSDRYRGDTGFRGKVGSLKICILGPLGYS